MRRNTLILLSVFITLMFSGLAYAATTVDIDEGAPYVFCTTPIFDKEGAASNDQIAISNADSQGCMVENSTSKKFDLALQYVAGPDYGTATVVLKEAKQGRFSSLTQTTRFLDQSIGSGDVTTPYVEIGPGDKVLIYTETAGNVINIDGFSVKPHK